MTKFGKDLPYFDIEMDDTLDSFWNDGMITSFLHDYLFAKEWNNVSRDVLKLCFHNLEEREQLPGWTAVNHRNI